MQRAVVVRILIALAVVFVVIVAALVSQGLDPTSAACAFKEAPNCLHRLDMFQCVHERLYCCRYGFDCHWVK